jgi:uncharacterized membrane protein
MPMNRPAAGTERLTAVDALRGGVMIVMALDHTRDFIHAGAMLFSPEDLTRTTPLLFLTRWLTHICAPTFMLLAGVGAALRLARGGRAADLSRFLWTRGLWLIVVEVTIMRLGWNFSLGGETPVLVLVLSALGMSMIALAALIYVPERPLLIGSVAVIVLHNTLDGVQASQFGAFAPVWNVLHQPGFFTLAGIPIIVGYPVIPWFAVMAAGFALGRWLAPAVPAGPADQAPPRATAPDTRATTRRALLIAGGILMVAFVLLRAANIYGDPAPWSVRASPIFTVLSFLRTTKYPPSLQFLLMTLGPALMLLACLDRLRPRWRDPLVVIGRVPMFFYVVHFWLLHIVASAMAWVRYGNASLAFLFHPLPSMGGPSQLFPPGFGYPLWVVYIVWIGICLALYPLCRRLADVKRRRRDWWLSYV